MNRAYKNIKFRDGFVFKADNESDEAILHGLEAYQNFEYFNLIGRRNKEKRQKLKDKVRRGLQKAKDKIGKGGLGKGLAKVFLSVPRQAAAALIRINFRGVATGISLRDEATQQKVLEKWRKIGGNDGTFLTAVNAGKNKPPLVCGYKCKQKRKITVDKSDFDGGSWNYPTGVEEAGIGGLILTGGKVVASLLTVVSAGKVAKGKEAEAEAAKAALEAEKLKAEREDANLSPDEKAAAERQKKREEELNIAIKEVENNPNLSDEEKAITIAEIQKSFADEESESFLSKYKWWLLGGLVVTAGAIILIKKNRNQ